MTGRSLTFAAILAVLASSVSCGPPSGPGREKPAPPPTENVAAAPSQQPEGETVFVINGTPVDEGEFRRYVAVFASKSGDEPPGKAVAGMADTFINNRLLAAEAQEAGLDRLPRVRSRLETRLNRLWTDLYWAEVVRPFIRVGDNELLAAAPPMEDSISLQQLTVKNREHAETLRARVLAGADFERIIREESVGLTARNGGKVGFVTRRSTMYDPALLEQLFRMSPGELTPVTATRTGYAIIRVLEKKTSARMREEWVKYNYRRLVGERELIVWRNRKAALARTHRVVMDRGVIDAFLRHGGKPPADLFDRVAVTVDGIPFLLRDLVDPSGIGIIHDGDTLEAIIRRRVEEFAVARDAARRGLPKRFPATALEEKLRRENLLAREYIDFRSRDLHVTEADRRKYYEENRERFVEPRALDLSFIETRSPERVKKIYELLRGGTPFEEVADAWSDNRQARGGRAGWVEEASLVPALRPVTRLKVGEYAATPIRIAAADGTGTLLVIPRLNGIRQPRVLPFREVDPAYLEKAVLARKRENVVRGIFEELRRRNRVVVTPRFEAVATDLAKDLHAAGEKR